VLCWRAQVATPKGEVALYNTLYSGFYGGNSTMDQILDREATRVVRDALLALRADPTMFHQVRVRSGRRQAGAQHCVTLHVGWMT